MIKNPRHTKCLKEVKTKNLKSALPALAHQNKGNMRYLHHIFNKFTSVFKHTKNHNLQVG